MVKKKGYPLVLLKAIEYLYSEIRKFVSINSDILEITKDEELEIIIEDRSKHSDFKFSVSKPKFEHNKTIFAVSHNPANSSSVAPKRINTVPDSILTVLKNWTNIIRQYNDISLTPQDRILNEYENEFFENFELIDEDADTHPYELEKQVVIHNFLTHAIKIFEKEKEENRLLIKEANELKENIPKWTKRTIVKKLSRLLANVRQKNLILLQEVLAEAKKELYKRAIKGSFDAIGDLISGM